MPEAGYPYGYCPLSLETLASSLGASSPPDLKETYAIGPVDPPPRPLDAMSDADERAVYAPQPLARRGALVASGVGAVLPGDGRPRGAVDGCLRRRSDSPTAGSPRTSTGTGRRCAWSATRTSTAPRCRGNCEPVRHTDYGTLTILRQDAAPGGLEIQATDGRWVPIPFEPGTYVVNIGDLMARWTNDRWRSTLHRVVLPPPDSRGSTERFSLPFFHNANWDALVECLPTCLEPGESPRYPPVRAGTHLMAKFRSTVT